ncbi:MAG: DJ-1/PfpI family protein [Candidatus Diapherotrites archaeon]
MAKVLFVIAPKDFRDEELFHTKEELEKAGHTSTIASLRKGACSGRMGGSAEATLAVDEAKASDFDAVVFVGGGGAAVYFENHAAFNLAKNFKNQEKIVSAICIAPSILANAGVLKGKKATCFPSEKDNLRVKGANYTGTPVEVDGRIITANGPEAARAFGKKIAEALK